MKETVWQKEFSDASSPWYWWWRSSEVRPGWFGKPWRDKTAGQRAAELGAFWFELARRHDRTKKSQPYPQANPQFRTLLAEVIVHRPPITTKPGRLPYGKARYVELPAIRFLASAARGVILEHIGNLLDQECEKRQIKLPKGPVGKQNVPPSWRWPELLDIREGLGEKLTDESERGSLSQARRDAAYFSQQLRERIREEILAEGD